MSKNLKSLLIVALKGFTFVFLAMVFFHLFGKENIALQNWSRTAVITGSTFVLIGILMLKVYGPFEIGVKKSKPIIYNSTIAIILTDLATFFQLMVMNTNPNNNHQFKIEQVDLLFYTIVIQIIIIIVFAYLGNYIYFKMYKPSRTIIVYDKNNKESLEKVNHYLKRFKLQYDILGCIAIDDSNLEAMLYNVDYVVILETPVHQRKWLVDQCYKHRLNFMFAPAISDIVELSGFSTMVDDKTMVEVNVQGLSFEQRVLKRLLDIFVALVGAIISSPIWIVSAIAIKLNDGGSILFKQKRATIDGKIFDVYKFRTMKENVDNYSATEDDDRITKVGKVLRKIRMDELPQLINILKGEMSIVGPRPEMLENVDSYQKALPEFAYRLKVKAGLTGLAQIEGKYNTSPKDKLLMDLMYIENYSIWTDFKLILRTVVVIFKKDSTEGF